MWLIHKTTGETGWYITQAYQTEPCERLVFVKIGNAWKAKLWKSTETLVRAKNHDEELVDDAEMKNVFRLTNPVSRTPQPENVSWMSRVIGYFF